MGQDKMHFKDYRSGMLTNGIERSAHRALLYSTGLDEADLRKPMIAVVNSFTEMVPGHFHLRELVDFVKQGIIEAGGIPRHLRWNLPGAQGHELPPAQPGDHCGLG